MLDKIVKSLSGEITEEENLQLNEWKESKENLESFQKIKKLWKLSESGKRNFQPDLEKGLHRFLNLIRKEKLKSERIIQIRRISYWAAASIILFVSTWLILQTNNTDKLHYITKAGQSLSVYLPDSSLIVMNENSTVSFLKDFKKRQLTLKGEAFFDIKRDTLKPFSIECANSIVSVLGTTFNVRSSKKEKTDQVQVITGKVSFTDKKRNDVKVVLKNGFSAELRNHKINENMIKDYNFLFYKTHELTFSNTALIELTKTLEKSYHERIEIISPELNDVKVTATYNSMTIDEIMNELEIILNISAQKVNTNWQLKKE